LVELAAIDVELGKTRLQQKDYESARLAFEKALRKDRDNPGALLGLAQVLVARKEDVEAIDVLERLMKLGASPPALALRLYAGLKAKRGDYRGALEMFEKAFQANPGEPQTLIDVGTVQHKMGQHDDALKTYRRAIDVSKGGVLPASSDQARTQIQPQKVLGGIDLYYMGRVMLDRNEDKGIALLEQSLKFESTPLEARFYLGRALFKRPKTKKQGKKELENFRHAAPEGDLSVQADKLLKQR
jgi:tetratricopeptide (TPR) repeat protein